MRKIIKLSLLCLLLLLPLVSVSVFGLEQQTQVKLVKNLQTQLKTMRLQSEINEEQYLNYNQILVQLENQWSQQTEEQEKPSEDLLMLSNLLDQQLQGLMDLEQTLLDLSNDKLSLTNTLENLQQIIASLRWDLEVALDRIGDAEEGAITLLDQNTELYNQNQQMARLTEQIRKEIGKMERRAALQPYVWFGGAAMAATGGYFMVDGLVNANPRNSITGAAIIGTDILIYITGHFIFKWW